MDLSVTNYIIFQNFIYSNYTESATNFVNTFIPITGTIHLAGTRLMTPSRKKGWIFFGKPFGSPTIKLDFGLRGGALWAIFQKNLNRTFFWTMYQCCNEASKIFEASKIIVQRLIFIFIFGQFSETKESLELRRFFTEDSEDFPSKNSPFELSYICFWISIFFHHRYDIFCSYIFFTQLLIFIINLCK